MEYEYVYIVDSEEVRFRCVDTAGNERDVDDVLLTPAYYSLGTLCLGILLMLAPLYVAVRQGIRGETGPEMQAALQQSYEQLRQVPSVMIQSDPNASALNASGKQQLEALDKLHQQGLINQEAYEVAKKRIFDDFSA
jgi:hypothetical protein